MTATRFTVYYLPKENYCGVTGRDINKRLWEHRYKFDRCTDGCIILAVFNDKREALDFESKYQIENNVDGYIFNADWRKKSSERLFKNGEDWIYKTRRKPIICNETGQIFNGVRDCERFLNIASGNLSKHLRGDKRRKSIKNLTFKYYETKKRNAGSIR